MVRKVIRSDHNVDVSTASTDAGRGSYISALIHQMSCQVYIPGPACRAGTWVSWVERISPPSLQYSLRLSEGQIVQGMQHRLQ